MSLSRINGPDALHLLAESEVLFEKKIVWGGIYSFSPEMFTFPEHSESITRSCSSEYSYFPSFEKALIDAVQRVWIIDKFFNDEVGYEVLEPLLEVIEASDIRIVSKTIHQELLEKLNSERKISGIGPIHWIPGFGLGNYDYAHDRFAVVDDELWHFGATVGGAHKGLQAASRGWNVKKTGADYFFNNLWKYLGGPTVT